MEACECWVYFVLRHPVLNQPTANIFFSLEGRWPSGGLLHNRHLVDIDGVQIILLASSRGDEGMSDSRCGKLKPLIEDAQSQKPQHLLLIAREILRRSLMWDQPGDTKQRWGA